MMSSVSLIYQQEAENSVKFGANHGKVENVMKL